MSNEPAYICNRGTLFLLITCFFTLTITACLELAYDRSPEEFNPPTPTIATHHSIRTPLPEETETLDGVKALVDVYFATDREIVHEPDGDFEALGERSMLDSISYGSVTISIPERHVTGRLERPSLTFEPRYRNGRFTFLAVEEESQNRHIFIQDKMIFTFDEFYSEMQRVENNSALIFIHGFNVSFDEAARRTAQLTFDLDFQGAPVFYSWPARGGVENYATDLATIEWTEKHLEEFLLEFSRFSNAENIYIIAHSMGTRGFGNAYSNFLTDFPEYSHRFRAVILAAPDIDRGVFRRDIAPIMSKGAPVTLYVSAKDQALRASGEIRDDNWRLGHYPDPEDGSAPNVFVYSGIETVDITDVDYFFEFLGHSTFADRRPVLVDISQIINGRTRAFDRFGLEASFNANGDQYWILKR